MDTLEPAPVGAFVRPGDRVFYREKGTPLRAALVGNVHEDGRTVDLVVLMEGDPRSPDQRTLWAMGNVWRARTCIVHRGDDPAGARHWRHDWEPGP